MLHTVLAPLPTRTSSARETYLTLRAAIVAGSLEPETRLYEHRIAAELGVSRTPVREALAMLEAEELVVSIPGKGALVRRVTPEEVRETYDVRAVLEGHAARLAAARIRAPELARLRRLAREMRRALERPGAARGPDVHTLTDLNADFHRTVAAASGNAVLARTIETLVDTPLHARAYFWYTEPGRLASFDAHDRMVELLAAGDPGACEAHWRAHLERGRDELIDRLAEPGEADA